MGIRHWIKKKRAEQVEDGEEDRAPSGSIFNAIFGREAPTLHALGEYSQKTYPRELQDLLRRREEVAEELREMDLTTRQARVDAIPRLQQMLRTYPHPLAYETLIHAYVDAGRWDEARGAAFAARERRTQVSRSPYSEIRSEINRLKEWTPEEVDLVRQEREGTTATVPTATATVSPVEMAARETLTEPVRQEEEVEATLQEISERPVEPVEPDQDVVAADAAPSDSVAESVPSADWPDAADRPDSPDRLDSADRSDSMDRPDAADAEDAEDRPERMQAAADRIEAEFVEPDDAAGGDAEEPASAGAAGGTSGGGAGRKGKRNRGRRR